LTKTFCACLALVSLLTSKVGDQSSCGHEDGSNRMTADTPTPDQKRAESIEKADSSRWMGKIIRVIVVLVVLAGFGYWAQTWVRNSLLYVTETDARIMADFVVVGATANGEIIDRPVNEGEVVQSGQLLARIDETDARLKLAELKSQLTTIDAEIARINRDLALAVQRLAAAVATRQAELKEALAELALVRHEQGFAEADLKRVDALARAGNAPRSRLDRAKTDALKAQQEKIQLDAHVAAARAAVAQAQAEAGQQQVLKAKIVGKKAQRAEVITAIDRQRHEIDRRMIRSPLAGVVDQTFAQAGEYVSRGARLLVIHDPEKLWVEANLRETDIARVTIGNVVDIRVDAYPDRIFNGRVTHIGAAANSRFSLLPNLNQSGNFTKVTQRIETHIAVLEPSGILKPGMMVEISIHGEKKKLF
jgi:membrane fusion protein (multidrug efflux system)